jgi:hypothetical protein
MWSKDGREYISIGKDKSRRWYTRWKCDACEDCIRRREDLKQKPRSCKKCKARERRSIRGPWVPDGTPFCEMRNADKTPRSYQRWKCTACGNSTVNRAEPLVIPDPCRDCQLRALKSNKHGSLTVLGPIVSEFYGNKQRQRLCVTCKCDCGNVQNVAVDVLSRGTGQCNQCATSNRSNRGRDAQIEAIKGRTFGWWKYLGEVPRIQWKRVGSRKLKAHTSQFLCLGCNTEHLMFVRKVTAGKTLACSRCIHARNARLRLDLSDADREAGGQLLKRTDSMSESHPDYWGHVDTFMQLVCPATSNPARRGTKVCNMNPARRAAYRLFVKENAITRTVRSVLRREVAAKAAGRKEQVGAVNCERHCYCSREFLFKYIESFFSESLNWNNYGHGKGKWSIDHFFPVASALEFGIVKYVNHWKNLMPISFRLNSIKSSIVLPEAVEHFYRIIDEVEGVASEPAAVITYSEEDMRALIRRARKIKTSSVR